jgi:hypothetical protein
MNDPRPPLITVPLSSLKPGMRVKSAVGPYTGTIIEIEDVLVQFVNYPIRVMWDNKQEIIYMETGYRYSYYKDEEEFNKLGIILDNPITLSAETHTDNPLEAAEATVQKVMTRFELTRQQAIEFLLK